MPRQVRSRSVIVAGMVATLSAAIHAQGAPRAAGAMRSIGTGGVVAIPVRFAGPGSVPVSRAALQERMFDGPSDIGTLTDYFRENSRGLFTLNGVVTDWVQSSMTIEQVGGGTPALSSFAIEAINGVDGAIDFRQYDNDGPDGSPNSGDDDGIVDGGVMIFTSNPPTFCGLGPGLSGLATHTLQASGGGAPKTNDVGSSGQPIVVTGAAFMSAVRCDGTVAGLSTTAHELGHLLFFFPEGYASGTPTGPNPGDGRRWRTGCWNLMAAGSGWGCGGPGFADQPTPTHLSPWEKQLLGWSTPLLVGDVRNAEFTIQPLASGGRALRVPISAGQYFEIEYRGQTGYDSGLPTSGVIIYHVDSSRGPPANCAACPPDSPPLLIEADGNLGLQRTFTAGGDKGVAGDVFGIGGKTTFSGVTTPAARASNGSLTTLTIHDILVDAAAHVARVRLTTSPTPAAVSALDTASVRAPLSTVSIESAILGGALPYSWSATGLPAGVENQSAGALLKLSGTIQAAGHFTPTLTVTDGRGTTTSFSFQWRVADLVTSRDRVLKGVLDPAASDLTTQEKAFLDRSGNKNDRLDVGDLRAYLIRNPPP